MLETNFSLKNQKKDDSIIKLVTVLSTLSTFILHNSVSIIFQIQALWFSCVAALLIRLWNPSNRNYSFSTASQNHILFGRRDSMLSWPRRTSQRSSILLASREEPTKRSSTESSWCVLETKLFNRWSPSTTTMGSSFGNTWRRRMERSKHHKSWCFGDSS